MSDTSIFPDDDADDDSVLPPFPDKHVLVIEGNVNMARAIVRVLQRAGYQTTVASDPSMALLLLRTIRPAVMTLDLRMINIGEGLGVLHELLRQRESTGAVHCKVLVVSGDPRTDMQLALAMGAHGALCKPLHNAALLAEIDRLYALSKEDAEAGTRTGNAPLH